MKVEGTSTTTVLMDTMEDIESVTMSIAAEDMGHIMSVLTDLYENPIAAIVREYPTNALDEHIEWKVKRPIEITLPSVMDPFFKVRDFGNGLDTDAIRTVYSQYGRSLKRDSNDVNGMLGLGSKSALTYSNQFTVISVKDGMKVTVLVTRNEDGAGTMRILGNEPSDEPSGTEIQIAIDRYDIQSVAEAAADFFQYWEAGLVLVNGEPPEFFADRAAGALKITDDLYIVKQSYVNDDIIVMGNVAYPYPSGDNYRDHYYVMRTPIGTVRPTPSREGLMDVSLTRNTVTALRKRAAAAIKAAIQEQVEEADSAPEALAAALAWADLSKEALKCQYNGMDLPEKYVGTPRPKADYDSQCLLYGTFPAGKIYDSRSWPASNWPTTLWVTNFPLKHFTNRHWMKAGIYRTEKDLSVSSIVLIHDESCKSPFIDPALIVDWETINAIELPTAQRKSRGGGNYYCMDMRPNSQNRYWHDIKAEDLPDAPFYTRGPMHYGRFWNTKLREVMSDGYFLASIPENRLDKFLRNFPKAVEAKVALQQEFDKLLKSFTEDEVMAYAYQQANYQPYYFDYWDINKIDDPEIKKLKGYLETDVSAIHDTMRTFRSTGLVGDLRLPQTKNPFKRYPLATNVRDDSTRNHIYLYMNTVYTLENA